MQKEKYVRCPLEVWAVFENSGTDLPLREKIVPLYFKWRDTLRTVDRVLERSEGPALKAGGLGIRFRCRVSWPAEDTGSERVVSKTSDIWFDPDEMDWFAELPERLVPPEDELP